MVIISKPVWLKVRTLLYLQERYPAVFKLAVHLENGQRVYFTEENARQRVSNPTNTTLTAFFKLCQKDEFAKTLLYHEVPKYYTWNTSKREFMRRKHGAVVENQVDVFETDTMGRVYTVHPNNSECFSLRMLLHEIKGPTSYESLRTVNEAVYPTYREACIQLGLLVNDQHWDMTMTKAAIMSHPNQIRSLFAIIITTCAPSDPTSNNL